MSTRPLPRILAPLLGLALSAALTTCGEKDKPDSAGAPEKVTPPPPPADPRAELDAQLARLMTGFGHEVKGVRDQSTWAAAKPRLEAILREIPRLAAKLRALPTPTNADFTHYLARTNQREADLETTLGDKDAFLAKLPPDVAAELMNLAGQFYNIMGDAQIALRGPGPEKGATPPSP
jgi:hypothetical protein